MSANWGNSENIYSLGVLPPVTQSRSCENMKGSGHGPNAANLRDAPRAEEQHEFSNYRKSRRRSSLEPMSKKPALGLGVSDPLAAFRFYSNWHRACYRGGRSAISAPARPRTAGNVEHAAVRRRFAARFP